jgi:hypothetical protein
MKRRDDRIASDRPKHSDARHIARQRRRVPIVVSLAAMIALSGIACGHQSPAPSPEPTSTDPPTATASGAIQYSPVTGAVTQAASGQPYFEIANQSNDTITVPPSTSVDFLESPIQ